MAVFSVQQIFNAFYNLSRLLAKCATASLKNKGKSQNNALVFVWKLYAEL